MSNKILSAVVLLNIAFGYACSSASAPGTNAVNATNGANVMTNIDPKNMPPGLSASPIPPSSNTTPGIPDPKTMNANLPKGVTPTPGIPDPKTIGKTPFQKGATPTPGIPDPETLKRQMNQTMQNVNGVNPAAGTPQPNGEDRPRTVRKP